MVKKIFKKTKNILFANPNLLYEKEKHLVKKSFYFKGTNDRAVLLLHGWTATPYELRRLAVYLNEKGYTVYGPILRGHGTFPEDLENVKYQDWIEDARAAYLNLKKEYQKVFIGGTSMGASITLCLAKEFKDIDGIILMATPYEIRLEKIIALGVRILCYFKGYRKKIYPPTFGSRNTITRIISYQTYPIKNALELASLVEFSRDNLEKIEQPCFIMQSLSDHIVTRSSMVIIYNKISSVNKKKKYIKKSYHTFISDIKNEYVFSDILDFINSI